MDMFHTPLQLTILPDSGAFSHAEADRVCRLATDGCTIRRIVVDMARADEATTSAFARLVLLRRALLKSGRDLRLTNLHDRAASLYEVIRLSEVLPKI